MVRVSVTICGHITVRSTVSHVPQLPPQELPHALPSAPQALPSVPQELPPHEPQELAPHGLQLEAQGAEQQELTFLPWQRPASADAVKATANASVRTYRMFVQLLLESNDSKT